MNAQQKLSALRGAIAQAGFDGYIVPRADEYQGEFVAPCAERLKWLTGFSGSAGLAVVLSDKAAVLSDGRYTIQLRQQVDLDLYETADSVKPGAGGWLADHAPQGARIGFDPRLHTQEQIEKIASVMQGAQRGDISLVPHEGNLIDAVWPDRPAPPLGVVELFPDSVAGKSAPEKIAGIASVIAGQGGYAAVLAIPDSVCWLLNVRGRDVECLPVVLSAAVVYAEPGKADQKPVRWIVDARKLPLHVREALEDCVEICDPARAEDILRDLAVGAKQAQKPVLLDARHTPLWYAQHIAGAGAQVALAKDPCIDPRACKSYAEAKAIREAHVIDGAAMAGFLHWLDTHPDVETLDEIAVEKKLRSFREASPRFRGDSFATIAGFGANGAIVHYRASPQTNASFRRGTLLLLDSGAQYEWGTTDITRTVAVGEPSEEMRRNFTRVLKGHVAVASARFAPGTAGVKIDALARASLREAGLDYAHGTGHGVGCYLSVHEEAASLSPRGEDAVRPGMLISNEPGYYKEGEYGIRIENLVLAHAGEDGMLGFETITFAPIDRCLIAVEMLTEQERAWMDAYHAAVLENIGPMLALEVREWLAGQCAPL